MGSRLLTAGGDSLPADGIVVGVATRVAASIRKCDVSAGY